MEFNATFIISIISFLVFIAIMNKIFYAPITKIVTEREEKLGNDYKEAETLNNQASEVLQERDKKLADATEEARKVISYKIEDFNNRSKTATTQAAKKAADEIKLRKDALIKSGSESEQVLNTHIENLADTIIKKVLGEEFQESVKVATEQGNERIS